MRCIHEAIFQCSTGLGKQLACGHSCSSQCHAGSSFAWHLAVMCSHVQSCAVVCRSCWLILSTACCKASARIAPSPAVQGQFCESRCLAMEVPLSSIVNHRSIWLGEASSLQPHLPGEFTAICCDSETNSKVSSSQNRRKKSSHSSHSHSSR